MTPPSDVPAIKLQGVNVRLNGLTILRDVTAVVPPSKLTAIIGPNGAGKTTLLRVLLGRIPYTGRIEMTSVNNRPPRIGYVPQQLEFDRGAPITVADFLCGGIQRRPLWLGQGRTARGRARRTLERVGIGRLLDRPLGRLSGGELQRVLLAMALLLDPQVLLLDEPVAGVDVAGRGMFCGLLDNLQSELGCSMVMVSHDLSVVTEHAKHVICLNQTVCCQGDSKDTLTAENLAAIYGPGVALFHHHGVHEGARHALPAHTHGHAHNHSHSHDHSHPHPPQGPTTP